VKHVASLGYHTYRTKQNNEKLKQKIVKSVKTVGLEGRICGWTGNWEVGYVLEKVGFGFESGVKKSRSIGQWQTDSGHESWC